MAIPPPAGNRNPKHTRTRAAVLLCCLAGCGADAKPSRDVDVTGLGLRLQLPGQWTVQDRPEAVHLFDTGTRWGPRHFELRTLAARETCPSDATTTELADGATLCYLAWREDLGEEQRLRLSGVFSLGGRSLGVACEDYRPARETASADWCLAFLGTVISAPSAGRGIVSG